MNGKEMREAMQNYEIKTTADQIIDAYTVRQEEKAIKKNKKPWWTLGSLSFLTTACAAVAIAMILVKPNNPDVPTPNEIQDDSNNRVAYQLLSGVELADFYGNNDFNRALRRNAPKFTDSNESTTSKEEFAKIVDVYDKANDMVNSAYLSKGDITKKIYEGTFKGTYKDDYSYKMEITGGLEMTFYYDSKIENDDELETTINGEIVKDDIVYLVKAESEQSSEEKEYEITIYFDASKANYAEIEQETEQNESEYVYRIYENSELTYEIEFENEGNEQTLKIKENNDEYEFVIEHSNSSHEVIEYKHGNVEGIIDLTIDQNGKTYVERDTQEKIVKN